MTEENKIELERQELNTLINKGVQFDVEYPVYTYEKGGFWPLKKRVKTLKKEKFVIQEPTLSTLDRISAEQIDLVIDENIMTSEQGIQEAKRFTNLHGRRLARIVALAALGEDYITATQHGARITYKQDDKRLEQLTELFFRHIKPSKLIQLTILVNQMSNLGDFTNSIRLMSASRTTMPIRIE
jgi:hypothetical protein